MLDIKEEKFGRFTQVKLINNDTKECFSFIPDYGACLNHLTLKKNNRLHQIFYSSDCCGLLSREKRLFEGAKLFPFPNRINNGKYTWADKKYQLPINFPSQNHAIHGLVQEKQFRIVDKKTAKDEATVWVELNSDGNIPGYPFKYKLNIIFSLSRFDGIICQTIAKNTDKVNIPIGDGWHPYFQTGTKINNLYLKLPADKVVKQNKKMIPTGKTVSFDKFTRLAKIGNHTFDTCYKIKQSDKNRVNIELYDPKQNLKLIVWQETGKNKYNYFQVYTPPLRNCIALEPMTCTPDAFNNKRGLVILKPKEKYSASFGVKIS